MLIQALRKHGVESVMIWTAMLGAIASTAFIAVNTVLGTVTETGNEVAIATVVGCAVLSWLAYLPGILGLTLGTSEGN